MREACKGCWTQFNVNSLYILILLLLLLCQLLAVLLLDSPPHVLAVNVADLLLTSHSLSLLVLQLPSLGTVMTLVGPECLSIYRCSGAHHL